MKAILNRTSHPLRVPLGGGKTLHLGPHGRGHVSDEAAGGPAFCRLVHDGLIDFASEAVRIPRDPTGGRGPHEAPHGHPHVPEVHPAGNRGGEPIRVTKRRET